MPAPTIVFLWASQSSATSTTGTPAANVGDLAIIASLGTNDVTQIQRSGSDAGWTLDGTVNGSGSNKTRVFSRVLTDADLGTFAGVTFLTAVGPRDAGGSWGTTGTQRFVLAIFRHASGFGSTRLVGTPIQHNTNISNGASLGTQGPTSRDGLTFLAITGGLGAGTATINGTTQTPYWNGGTGTDTDGPLDGTTNYGTGATATQADARVWNGAQSSFTVATSAGQANTTHAIVAVTYQVQLAAAPSDTAGLTDSITATISKAATYGEAVGITDTVTSTESNIRTITDAIGAVDTVTAVKPVAYARTITDAIGLTDSRTQQLTVVTFRTYTEPVGATDAAARTASYARTITDPLGATDNVPGLPQSHARTITDPVGVTDTGSVLASKADTVGITDSIVIGSSAAISDPAGIQDQLARTLARTITDPVGLTDSRQAGFVLQRLLVEPVGLTDQPGRHAGYARTRMEAVGLTDTATAGSAVEVFSPSCVASIVWHDANLDIVWATNRTDIVWCV